MGVADKVLLRASAGELSSILSAPQQKARDRALKVLPRWMQANEIQPDHYVLLWKGAFLCLWMADGPEYQLSVMEAILKVLQGAPDVECAVAIFIAVVQDNWGSLDVFRVEKFQRLLRLFVRQLFTPIKLAKFTPKSCRHFVTYLRAMGNGLPEEAFDTSVSYIADLRDIKRSCPAAGAKLQIAQCWHEELLSAMAGRKFALIDLNIDTEASDSRAAASDSLAAVEPSAEMQGNEEIVEVPRVVTDHLIRVWCHFLKEKAYLPGFVATVINNVLRPLLDVLDDTCTASACTTLALSLFDVCLTKRVTLAAREQCMGLIAHCDETVAKLEAPPVPYPVPPEEQLIKTSAKNAKTTTKPSKRKSKFPTPKKSKEKIIRRSRRHGRSTR